MNKSIKNSIIYNVYPTSFFDSNGDGVGDLKGIAQKLPYIKRFADIVWINPVYKSPFRDGGYDIEDYYSIDERFGTMDDVKALIDRAHELGLKIIFDLVVGHTSDQHKWFLESRKHDRNKYSDYYIWNDDVFGWMPGGASISGNSERNGNYLINFFCFQPALNFGYSKKTLPWQHLYTDEACCKVHEEVIKIIKHYLAMGLDGFRVDLANSIVKEDVAGKYSCEVWRKIFGKVREEYPDAIFVSEWGEPMYAVKNGDFDVDFFTHCHNDGYNCLFRKESGTNVFASEGHSFFRRDGQGETSTFFDFFKMNLEAVKDKGYVSIVTGNHDLPRISIDRTPEDLKLVFAFILALPSVPLIYYGDEIGMPYSKIKSRDGGFIRTGSRTPMQWSAGKNAGFSDTDGELYLPVNENYKTVNVETELADPNSLVNCVKEMVGVKREYSELFSCDSEFELVSEDYPAVFKRSAKGKTLTCAFNPSDREYEITLPEGKVISSVNTEVDGESVKLHPLSYIWTVSEQ